MRRKQADCEWRLKSVVRCCVLLSTELRPSSATLHEEIKGEIPEAGRRAAALITQWRTRNPTGFQQRVEQPAFSAP
jgi:hypothetical protein